MTRPSLGSLQARPLVALASAVLGRTGRAYTREGRRPGSDESSVGEWRSGNRSGDTARSPKLAPEFLLVVTALVFAFALVGGSLALAVGPVAAQDDGATVIDECDFEIDEAGGEFVLTDDLEGSTHPCIYVTKDADDVTIDGNGHVIRYVDDGDHENGAVGVRVRSDGVTLRNVTVEGFEDGVYVDAGSDAVIEDFSVRDSERWGLRLSQAHDVTVRNATVVDSGERGVRLYETERSLLENLSVTGSGVEGLYVQGGSTATVRDSDFSTNHGVGIKGFQAELDLRDVAGPSNDGHAVALNESSATATAFDLGASTEPGTTVDFEAADVWIDASSDPAPAPESQTDIGRFVSVGEHVGDPTFDVDLRYEEPDVRGANESSLALWGYDDREDEWVALDSTWDGTDRTISTSLDDHRFGDVGAFAEPEPHFDVEFDDASTSVLVGEELTANVTVENLESVDGEQPVTLSIEGEEVDRETVALEGGDATTVSLTWGTNESDRGEHEMVVTSEDDEASTTVAVDEPSTFTVTDVVVEPPTPAPGDDVTVTATVSNDGDRNGTQDVVFSVDSEHQEIVSITVEGGDETTTSFSWTPERESEFQLTVATDDDVSGTTVTVAEPGGGLIPPSTSHPVDLTVDSNSPVRAGGTLEVTATVSNDGDEQFADDVTLSVDGHQRDSTAVDVGAGETDTVTLTWSTSSSDAGTYTATVAAGDVSRSLSVTVSADEPTFSVTIENVTSPVVERQPVVVWATIEPAADEEQTVHLQAPSGSLVDSEVVDLRAGEPTTVSLTWTPEIGDARSGFVTVETEDDTAVTGLTIQETPAFDVEIVTVTDRVVENESVLVDARVSSSTARERTGYLTLEAEGERLDGRPITLSSAGSETVRLEWPTEAGDAGEHALRVDAGSDDATTTVTIVDGSNGLLGVGPEWTGTAVDYEPSEQTRHVGVFLWLTILVGALGLYVLATRSTLDARLLGVTLLVAGLRTGTDVLHAALGGTALAPLLALNTALELYVGLLFLLFAAVHVGDGWPLDRRGLLGVGATVVLVTGTIAANPGGLVFTNVTLAEAPFTYVTAETGPLGWLILTATLATLLVAFGLLVRSFLDGAAPSWRPVGVLATGLVLAVVVVLLSVLDRGPLPHYDYTGAGMAGFLALATTTLFGHGLQRIKETAQQSLVEDLDDPIVVTNDAGVVVECNAAAVDLLPGVSEHVRFGRLVAYEPEWPASGETTAREETRASLVPSRQPAGSSRSATSGGATGDRTVDIEEAQHYLVRTSPVEPDTGDAIGYTVRFTDVTELKRRTAALERKNAQLEQVASTVSHDLRNPLSVAEGYVDMIRQTVPAPESGEPVDPAAVGDHLDPILRALDRMDAIIADILALARGDDTVTETETVEFDAVVEEAWETVDTDGAILHLDSTGLLDADRDRMRRILENLFRNAVEHGSPSPGSQARQDAVEHGPTSPGSQAHQDAVEHGSTSPASQDRQDAAGRETSSEPSLTADREDAVEHGAPASGSAGETDRLDSQAVVTVRVGLTDDGFFVEDDGSGIPPQERAVVFEEGYSSEAEGTGLGLAIVSQLASAHGWDVSIDPDHDGARFVFEGATTLSGDEPPAAGVVHQD